MNMRIRAMTVENENKELSKKLTIWQNVAVVALIINVILTITIVIIIIS